MSAHIQRAKTEREIALDNLSRPDPHAVPWVCTSALKPGAEATVKAQHWDEARTLGAALLGVNPLEVEAVKVKP